MIIWKLQLTRFNFTVIFMLCFCVVEVTHENLFFLLMTLEYFCGRLRSPEYICEPASPLPPPPPPISVYVTSKICVLTVILWGFFQARLCCSPKRIWICILCLVLLACALDAPRYYEWYLSREIHDSKHYILVRKR